MEYITAFEMAKMKISGLPESDRRLREKAKRENWRSRPRVGRGGGVEYEIAALPTPIREAVEKKLAAEILAQQPDLPNMQTVSGSLNPQNQAKPKKSRAKSKDRHCGRCVEHRRYIEFIAKQSRSLFFGTNARRYAARAN